MVTVFAAMPVLDRPDLLEHVILVNGLWVLPPAMVVAFVNGELDGDISWRWVFSRGNGIDP